MRYKDFDFEGKHYRITDTGQLFRLDLDDFANHSYQPITMPNFDEPLRNLHTAYLNNQWLILLQAGIRALFEKINSENNSN